MAEESPLSSDGELTEYEYEWLAAAHQPDGLIGHPDDPAPCYASGGQIIVRAGQRGVLRGFPWASGAVDVGRAVNTAGAARTDLVVLRLFRDEGHKTGTDVLLGTPGAGAPAPRTGTGPADWYEIPLAEYDVANGGIVAVRRRAWYIGPDGQILCTKTTRPPHYPGRRIREIDTGRSLESTGEEPWLSILDDSGWLNLAPAAGWGRNTLRIRRMSGVAYLHLDLDRSGASLAASTTSKLCTIPADYRLGSGQLFSAAVIYHGKVGRISINAAGDVNLSNHEGINSGQYLVSSASWPIG